MNEKLLQYIWQYQYYNNRELETVDGEQLRIIDHGRLNHHQGPDFLNGKVMVGQQLWAGNIELHVLASDWMKHAHDGDPNYTNIILHVVWVNDRETGTGNLPVLELQDRVSNLLLHQYENLLKRRTVLPCSHSIHLVDKLTWCSWKDRLLFERLERKSELVLQYLEKSCFHWEEVLWWLTARAFGLTVNADAFAEMAMSITYSVIGRYRNRADLLEALFMGQAGLLDRNFTEQYPLQLKKDYYFLKDMHGLQKISISVHYLRMRPAAFPEMRLALFAQCIHHAPSGMPAILRSGNIMQIKKILEQTAGEYWNAHYRFGKITMDHPKKTGAQLISTVIINSFAPFLFTYGQYKKEPAYMVKALEWMHALRTEKNTVASIFDRSGLEVRSAACTQAIKELTSQYCEQRKCLQCSIGNSILRIDSGNGK